MTIELSPSPSDLYLYSCSSEQAPSSSCISKDRSSSITDGMRKHSLNNDEPSNTNFPASSCSSSIPQSLAKDSSMNDFEAAIGIPSTKPPLTNNIVAQTPNKQSDPTTAAATAYTGNQITQQTPATQIATPVFGVDDDIQMPTRGENGEYMKLVCDWGASTTVHLITKDTFVIGRGAKNCDLVINLMRVSSKHCIIEKKLIGQTEQVFIRDISSNGTYLNRIRMEKDKDHPLHQGDWIFFGLGIPGEEVRLYVHALYTEPPPSEDKKKNPTSPLHANYIIKDSIGTGAFADVRVAVSKKNGSLVAVKLIDRVRVQMAIGGRKRGPSADEMFSRELDIVRSLNHPNIIKLYECFKEPDRISIVLEYAAGGDLMDFLLRRDSHCLKESEARYVVKQIVDALRYIHHKGIVHRDLKPENILLTGTSPRQVKITDFGLAKMVFSGEGSTAFLHTMLRTFCGTLGYLAPEVFRTKAHGGNEDEACYDAMVDLWSLGCVTYTVLTGIMPFSGANAEETSRNIRTANYPKDVLYENEPGLRSAASLPAVDFIEHLLQVEPSRRMSAEEAWFHDWLEETAEFEAI